MENEKLSRLHQRATLSLLAVEREMCNLTEVNIILSFLLSRCPPFFCQDTYIVSALKCINFAVLIGIFVRCGVPLAPRELAPRDQHCHIALRHFYLKAAP